MYTTLRAKDWNDARAIGNELTRWVFRGHADSEWPVDSTLQRSAMQFNCPPKWLNHREYWMLRQFERRAHHYVRELPEPQSKLDWLALIQHFGGPTRLVDFSHSFYVAAFFAMERASGDAAIWAVSCDKIERPVSAFMKVSMGQENIDHMNARHVQLLNGYIGLPGPPKDNPQLVLTVEPDRLHERLTIQQGLFLCATDLALPFADSLAQTVGLPAKALQSTTESEWDSFTLPHTASVLRIVLPRKIHRRSLEDLARMNITSTTLFPGLDGFARSMHLHLRMFDVSGEAT